ncbi:MAG TPA: hypothetical protein VJ691_18735 [Vicinamibacterales bacterium]|nr:hypothetical protein [Vicinamibacterales bacterium]
MSVDARFDRDRKLLRITVTDAWPTLPEIVALRSQLILEGCIRPDVVELVDARMVSRAIPNLSQMKAILRAIDKPPLKRALLVSTDVQYAAGRLAELLDPTAVRVFRDESVALAWLFEHRSNSSRTRQAAFAKL